MSPVALGSYLQITISFFLLRAKLSFTSLRKVFFALILLCPDPDKLVEVVSSEDGRVPGGTKNFGDVSQYSVR